MENNNKKIRNKSKLKKPSGVNSATQYTPPRKKSSGGGNIAVILIALFIGGGITAFFIMKGKKQNIQKSKGISLALDSDSSSVQPNVSVPKSSECPYGNIATLPLEERLKKLMPASGFKNMAQEKYHCVTANHSPTPLNSQAERLAYISTHIPFLLGQTGILAVRTQGFMGYRVTGVQTGSPASGKIRENDIIYAANGKKFAEYTSRITGIPEFHYPNPQMGLALEESEAKGDGLLTLNIKRNGKTETVKLYLKPTGAFSSKFPYESTKADWLVDLNAKILASKQLESGWWDRGYSDRGRGKKTPITSYMVAISLMATGNPEFDRNLKKFFEASLNTPLPKNFKSWNAGYRGMFLGEYYLKFRDPRAKQALEKLMKQCLNGICYYNGIYGYGHSFTSGTYYYGGINICTGTVYMVMAMAKACGIPPIDNMYIKLAESIERVGPDGYVDYVWKAKKKGPMPVPHKYNQDTARTGIMSIAYRILGGPDEHYDKMVKFLHNNSSWVDASHASGGSLGWFWGSISIGLDKRYYKLYAEHIQNWRWYLILEEMHNGGFYTQPSAKGQQRQTSDILGPNFLTACNIMLMAWKRHQILITGKESYLPASGSVPDNLVPSGRYFAEKARAVEAAAAAGITAPDIPPPLHSLISSLKSLDPDKKEYEQNLKSVYAKYLKQAVEQVLKLQISSEKKELAISLLLGIDFNTGGILMRRHRKAMPLMFLPPNTGTLSGNIKINEKNIKKITIETSPLRAVKKRFVILPRNSADKGTIDCEWEGLHFTLHFPIHKAVKFDGKHPSPAPYMTQFGPISGTIEFIQQNGMIRILLPGGVTAEYALNSQTELLGGGRFKNLNNAVKRVPKKFRKGTKVKCWYYMPNLNLTKPICSKLEIQ